MTTKTIKAGPVEAKVDYVMIREGIEHNKAGEPTKWKVTSVRVVEVVPISAAAKAMAKEELVVWAREALLEEG